MSDLLAAMHAVLTQDAVARISKGVNVDPALVTQAIGVIAPLALAGFARAASTEERAADLLSQLSKQSSADLMTRLTYFVLGPGANQSSELAETLFASGEMAIGATLSDRLGFNVRPLLATIVPLMATDLLGLVKTGKLDAGGLRDLLQQQNDAYMNDPAHRATAGLISAALTASDNANAVRDVFDQAEWSNIRQAPLAALYHVATSSPSGPVGEAKEFNATADAVAQAARAAPAGSVISAAFNSALSTDDLDRFREQQTGVGDALAHIRNGIEIVMRKRPADAQAYRDMVMTAAKRAAEAAIEGGMLGSGGERVNAGELRALEEIRSALN
jgi:hypothetical protein